MNPTTYNYGLDKTGKPVIESALPSQAPITPIPLNALQPVAPIAVPPIPPPTQGTGLAAYIGHTATQTNDQFAQDQAAQVEAAKAAKDTSLSAWVKGQANATGEAQATNTLYDTGGVNTAAADVKDINNQIIADQVATNHQIETLKQNTTGLYGGALEQEIQKVKDQSLARQADLSVIQMAKQGKYDSAKAIADRAVAALVEADNNKNAALKTIYDDNKDTFSTAEQHQFETAQKARETEAANKEYRLRAQFDQTIKQHDPLYQAQLTKTLQEIDANLPVTVTNPNASRYAGALNVILGSGKFTKDQKASLIASVNQGEDPFTVVKNQAKNIMGGTEATTVTKYETAQASLQDIQNQLKAFYANGGKTNIFAGNYEKTINNLGEVNDPKLVDLATQIQASLQIYRNAVSGTAYSSQEGADIASIFPGINKSEGLNNAILKGRMTAFSSAIDGTYRSALGSNYDALKNADAKGVKQDQSDAQFVESTLKNVGASYDEALKAVGPGEIAAINNKTGEIQAIQPWEYDAKLYTKL